MKVQTSLRQHARAVALLVMMSGAATVVGQVAVTNPAPEPSAVESSTEQGHTQLDESFPDWRDWRLEKRRQALKDTKFEFNLRTYYFDRSDFSSDEKQAWAIGGWAGFKTGYFLDHIAFGATGYLSEPLYAPDDRDGTTLLAPGQEGYEVLGEAYAEIRIIDGLTINVGRKGYDTPFINRNDSRMTPNTFEAIVLQGRVELEKDDTPTTVVDPKDGPAPAPTAKKDLAVIKYGLGYFDQIKERNSDDFVSMARDAGADAERGVFSGGAIYEKGKFSIGAIDYYSEDIINIAYAETKMELPFSPDFKPRLAAQFVDQRNTGDNLLQGNEFNSDQIGLKLEVPVQKLLFTAAFTTAWGDANLRAPWSGYPGYTSVQVQDFNRMGESAFLFRIGYDFPGVDGLSAYALAVFGTDPDGDTQYRQDEYDVNLQWAPKKNRLKGLSLRLRYGVVNQDGGGVDNLTDFRAICNYVINF